MRWVVAILLVAPSGMTIAALPTRWELGLGSVPCDTAIFQRFPTTEVMVSPDVTSFTKLRPKVSLSTCSAGLKSRPQKMATSYGW